MTNLLWFHIISLFLVRYIPITDNTSLTWNCHICSCSSLNSKQHCNHMITFSKKACCIKAFYQLDNLLHPYPLLPKNHKVYFVPFKEVQSCFLKYIEMSLQIRDDIKLLQQNHIGYNSIPCLACIHFPCDEQIQTALKPLVLQYPNKTLIEFFYACVFVQPPILQEKWIL